MKKNNKGFSLVELIVVILIMAIIAVAIPPQVMKWVENSRIAKDMNTRAELENVCKRCLSDREAFLLVADGDYELHVTRRFNDDKIVVTCVGGADPDTDLFWKSFFKEYGCADKDEFEESVEIKSSPTNGKDIELIVYVYRGGCTFSILKNFHSDDFEVS